MLLAQLSLSSRWLEAGRWVYHLGVLWILLELVAWRASAFAGHETFAVAFVVVAVVACAGVLSGRAYRLAALVFWLATRAVLALNLDSYTADEMVELFGWIWIFAPAPRAKAEGSEPFALLLVAAISTLYLASVIHKFYSEIWLSGTAIWLGGALPLHGPGWLADWPELGPLTRLMTWSTLAYEALFPLCLLRSLRRWLVPFGIGMHVASAVLLPLPQFGVLLAGALLPLVPSAATPQPVADTPARRRLAAASVALALLLVFCQVAVERRDDQHRDRVSAVLGVHKRPIYLDWHFTKRGEILRFQTTVAGETVLIPSFDEQGHPQVRDRYWKILGWYARRGPAGREKIDRYLSAWFEREEVEPARVEFLCRAPGVSEQALRRIDVDLVRAVREQPWTPCGAWEPTPAIPVR